MNILDSIENFFKGEISKDDLAGGKAFLTKEGLNFNYKPITNDEFAVSMPDESGGERVVYVLNILNHIRLSCQCAEAKKHLLCVHGLAAALYLRGQLLENDFFETGLDGDIDSVTLPGITNTEPTPDVLDTTVYASLTMPFIDYNLIMQLSGGLYTAWGDQTIKKIIPVDVTTAHHKFQFVINKNEKFDIDIIYDGNVGFETHCSCGQEEPLLCLHVMASFSYLYHTKGQYHFIKWKHFTEEKNKILQTYGLTLDDPEANEFIFEVDTWTNKLVLRSKPLSIIPVGSKDIYEDLKKTIIGNENHGHASTRPKLDGTVMIDYEVGFVFNFTSSRNFGFEFETAFVREKGGRKDLKKLSLNKESNWPFLQTLPAELYDTVLDFYEKNMIKWLVANGGTNVLYHSNPWQYMNDTDMEKNCKRHYELLKKIWPQLCTWPNVFGLLEGNFSNKNVNPIKLAKEFVGLSFVVGTNGRFITIKWIPLFPEKSETNDIVILNAMFLYTGGVLYLPSSADSLGILRRFYNGILKFPIREIKEVLTNVISPLQAKYPVDIQGLPNVEYVTAEQKPRIMFSEMNNQYLMAKPQFLYDDVLVDYNDELEHIGEDGGKVTIIKRNKVEERNVYEYLRTLHPKFANQHNNLYYYLPFNEVMVKNWFLEAVQKIQEAGMLVFGLQELKKFKYNTNKPTFEIKTGSGVDWFDLKISISWGDQDVSIKDIRKAMLNKQDAILLGDGTLGLIPQEWIKQYAPIMKMATEQSGTLRLSKLHYALLDDIDDTLDSEEVKREIAEKKKKLLQYDKIKTVTPSAAIQAELRPYQLSGFNWLQSLNELGWGGCLADDMGLGKTLQTITFLQYLKEKDASSTHLVVCPTSLIFNWESELHKFCPGLKYHTYYGAQRNFDDDHFEKFNLVLTTYGMVRSDFEHLQKFSWHYVILDESQAIKNPDALVTKAVQMLQAKNRLILSGTPVQNNTQDLYAQFTFLNPGFLGNREFFKNEFSQPIDKHGDKEKAEQLRRMIYPFMLRRTKEQVATDLPDKTEMVLWCTMEKVQRRIYDEYKEYYRNMLMQKIEEGGLAKAGIYVLEGLLRLRQICDHPALLKDKKIKNAESVKINELMREIRENTGDHKLLIFSQFTEMLSLVKVELANEGIAYCYLDGSTPAHKRKEQVTKFQDDESIKVFLISLKAGGVGLNLTSADYVYLIDPWWNPATEQQAIDRTHRIGQTKKVFAYKMICKETVEEKILQLQEKKKLLANELVSEEAGFVKKLTRDDIEYLFS